MVVGWSRKARGDAGTLDHLAQDHLVSAHVALGVRQAVPLEEALGSRTVSAAWRGEHLERQGRRGLVDTLYPWSRTAARLLG